MLIYRMIPDIKMKFPRLPAGASTEDSVVWVQQDNARPRLINDDPEVKETLSSSDG